MELNRAVAVSFAYGPAAGLELEALASEPSLKDYHLFPSVRADPLGKLNRREEALDELKRAASLAVTLRNALYCLLAPRNCADNQRSERLVSSVCGAE